jgi:ribosomal protein S18 acetylase RimI-like enzyme
MRSTGTTSRRSTARRRWAISHQGSGLGKQVVANLVELLRGHKETILYAVPSKEGFYGKLGFLRMLTAMAIFEDQAGAPKRGYLSENCRGG